MNNGARQRPVAILGSGNVGQAIAGHLASQGYRVRLYSRWDAELEPIRQMGGISLHGELTGRGCPDVLTTDMREAVAGAALVLIAAPAFAHRFLSGELVECVAEDQMVVFQPGVLGSALEFLTLLEAKTGRRKVLTAETETSVYTCRTTEPGRVFVSAMKPSVGVAAVPAADTARVVELLRGYFGTHYAAGSDVLTTGLSNTNPVYHCPPSLLNFSGIERGIVQPFHELVTAGIARVMDVVDKERLALGDALGLKLGSWWSFLARTYGVADGDLVERIHKASRRRPFPAPTSPAHRYLTEDIPFGFVPWSSIAGEIGVPTPAIDALIEVANVLYGHDVRQDGRTVESLGLKGLSARQIRDRFVLGTLSEVADDR